MACEYEDRDREASKTRLHTKVTLYRQYKDELSSEKKTANASLSPSLARSREAHFACPNRRACSQAIERQAFYYPKITKLLCLQRCVACEVRVNLNYSTEVHFTLFYWFKSRRWQCKSNRACAKVTWKPGKQQTWRLILRRSAFRTTFTRTMKLCNLLLKWLLGSNLSHIVHFVHPNCKW